MTSAEQLTDIEALRQLKAKYCRGFDTKQWDLFTSIFTDDAVFDFRGAAQDPDSGETLSHRPETTTRVMRGSEAIEIMIALGDQVRANHYCHTAEFEFQDRDRATGIWAMCDTVRFPEGSEKNALYGYGFYHEEYVKSDGAWKIASITLKRTRVDFV